MSDLHWVMWSFYFPHGKFIWAGPSEKGAYGFSYVMPADDKHDVIYDVTLGNVQHAAHTLQQITVRFIFWSLICPLQFSDKETSFLDLNIKVIGGDIHTSVYDKRDDFGFPIVNFPWLSGDVPRLPSYGIYISQLVRFARCCTSVLDFHSKNLQITSKLLTQGYRYHKLRKTFGKFFRSYSELLSKFGDISFQEYLSKGISHPVFYGDLVYKLRRVKDTPNFILSGSKIVKRLRRRQYDPVIIERTIGLVLGPSTALYEPFLKHCTLTNKAVGTIWRALSKPPQRRQGPDLCPLWLLVGTPSAIRPELAFSRGGAQPTLFGCR